MREKEIIRLFMGHKRTAAKPPNVLTDFRETLILKITKTGRAKGV